MKTTMRALAVLALGLTPLPAAAQDADTILAKVNGTDITLGHVVGIMARLPDQVRQMPDDALFQGILDQLVDQTALLHSTTEPMSLRAKIDMENSQREVLVNDVLNRRLSAAITEEALRDIYAERYLGGEPAREYNAAHILVETEEEAQEVLAALEDGADFADLARDRSRDPGSAANGGDLGWFGLGRMVPAFEEAVVGLAPGETSAPIETQFGWHVVRLLDSRDTAAPDFEAVRGQLANELQQQVVMDAIAEARAAADIEIMGEGIDPALIRDQTLLDD